jgi:hypothetical protein
MRDTVWVILLTQTPIAIACLWVALELRAIRRALERIADAARRMDEKDDGGGR